MEFRHAGETIKLRQDGIFTREFPGEGYGGEGCGGEECDEEYGGE